MNPTGQITLIKAEGERPTWIVKRGDRFIGEIVHVAPLIWAAETMRGRKFRARSKRQAITLLKIDAAQPLSEACHPCCEALAELRAVLPDRWTHPHTTTADWDRAVDKADAVLALSYPTP